MQSVRNAAIALLLIGAVPTPEVPVGARIVDKGLAHSEVMATATSLADHIGGRLTNAPAMREADAWAKASLRG